MDPERPELIIRGVVFAPEGDGRFDGAMAAVAEQADGSGFALHILRPHTPGERGPYTLVTNEGATVEGGVVRWDCGDRHLDLDLAPEAAEALMVPPQFRLLLRADRMTNQDFLAGIGTLLQPNGE